MKPSKYSYVMSVTLMVLGFLLTYIFWKTAGLSEQFELNTAGNTRPILSVLGWFWAAFALYLIGWITVGGFLRYRNTTHDSVAPNLLIIVGFGILFRVLMIPSIPIQEIDLYRYIWDGAVLAYGSDPYLYAPGTVLNEIQAPRDLDRETPSELIELKHLVARKPGLEKVLETTHFGEYTTPYPPISQLFFAIASGTLPRGAEAFDYVVAMKAMLVLFDIATGFLVILLLSRVGLPRIHALAYWWCPLLIKEIANSGHLDSIAIFFCVLAVYLTVCALWRKPVPLQEDSRKTPSQSPEVPNWSASLLFSLLSAVALAAAVAAKVFPIVLAPIWAIIMLRRLGIMPVLAIVLFVVSTIGFCWPMARHMEITQRLTGRDANLETIDQDAANETKSDPSGIEAFSKYWEMNDFLFMLVVENLKPTPNPNNSPRPWFQFTSNSFREQTVERARPIFELLENEDVDNHQPAHYAFFTTRAITVWAFSVIVLWSCIVVLRQPDAAKWLECTFLTLAWFWLLSPTQNPWYWTWSLPLLAFARGRVWFFMSGVLFAYYLRFWFEYHYTGIDVIAAWETTCSNPEWLDVLFPYAEDVRYQGTAFFDFYVPIYEFGPWFVVLLVASFARTIVAFAMNPVGRVEVEKE